MKTGNENKQEGMLATLKNLAEKIGLLKKKKDAYPFALQPIPVKKNNRGIFRQ